MKTLIQKSRDFAWPFSFKLQGICIGFKLCLFIIGFPQIQVIIFGDSYGIW